MPIEVPPNYVSKDVEDRTTGQNPSLVGSIADHIRGLLISVRDDYNSSLKGQTPLQVGPNDAASLDDAAVQRIHARLTQKLGGSQP